VEKSTRNMIILILLLFGLFGAGFGAGVWTSRKTTTVVIPPDSTAHPPVKSEAHTGAVSAERGDTIWLHSRDTVRLTETLYERDTSAIGALMRDMQQLADENAQLRSLIFVADTTTRDYQLQQTFTLFDGTPYFGHELHYWGQPDTLDVSVASGSLLDDLETYGFWSMLGAAVLYGLIQIF